MRVLGAGGCASVVASAPRTSIDPVVGLEWLYAHAPDVLADIDPFVARPRIPHVPDERRIVLSIHEHEAARIGLNRLMHPRAVVLDLVLRVHFTIVFRTFG